MRDLTHTAASQKVLIVIGVAANPFCTTIEYHSNIESMSASSECGDSPPSHFQRDGTGSFPKVSRASRLHIFSPEELHSILLLVTHTLQTHSETQGTSFAHARIEPRTNLTMGQGDQGDGFLSTTSFLWCTCKP